MSCNDRVRVYVWLWRTRVESVINILNNIETFRHMRCIHDEEIERNLIESKIVLIFGVVYVHA